ncbi:MAG: glucan biosynthesis protein [Myxococcales bacterium]
MFVQNTACAAGAAFLAQCWGEPAAADAPPLPLGPAEPFDFAELVKKAAVRASAPYVPAPKPAPEIMAQMIYDQHEAIHYRPDRALFADSPYPVFFRHLGKLFPSTVKMYALDGGQAREVLYDPSLFTMPKDSVAKKLPKDAGFAGLSFQTAGKFDPVDKGWLCFLGASYFRGVGENTEMGISARAVAVNTAPPGKEEFPGYVAFYIAGAKGEGDPVVVHALLDSPSISGAYRFTCHRKNGVTMEVECRLFLREDIDKLGIAPLTSMFWYAEYGRGNHIDWRPEVHDSDGLLLWTGSGKRIFRALENYKEFTISTFPDKNPKGFGLTQRDRDQNHFLDPVYYERRPSLWIEPIGNWGSGHVELVEIPTVDEYHDNLVSYWVPAAPSKKGAKFEFNYRMHWRNDEPYPPSDLARVRETYIGRGGEPATPDPVGITKFVVEFQGKPLDAVADPKQVVAKLKTSLGEIVSQKMQRVPNTTRYQIHFDVKPGKPGVAELEATLFVGQKPVTETWRYRFVTGKT